MAHDVLYFFVPSWALNAIVSAFTIKIKHQGLGGRPPGRPTIAHAVRLKFTPSAKQNPEKRLPVRGHFTSRRKQRHSGPGTA